MNADQVRELAARREGPALDFKREQYDWSADGNLELAKDIMAIANALPRGSGVGHILIGVEEQPDGTGRVVGVAPTAHLDDASMHQKIRMLPNRVPSFAYAAVDVDGSSVGIFEIRAGGRPFFALRDGGSRHRLRRFEAPLRVGTATDAASPDQIYAWATEDDPSLHNLRRVEIEERESKLLVRPFIEPVGISFTEDRDTCEEALVLDLILQNRGESRFTIESVRQTWTLTPRFYADFPDLTVRASTPHTIAGADPGGAGLAPGESHFLKVPVDCDAVTAYLSRELDLHCSSSEWPLWLDGEVSAEVVGVTGRRGSFARAIPPAAIEAAYEAGRAVATAAREQRKRLEAEGARDRSPSEIPLVETIPASPELARRAAEIMAGPRPRRRR